MNPFDDSEPAPGSWPSSSWSTPRVMTPVPDHTTTLFEGSDRQILSPSPFGGVSNQQSRQAAPSVSSDSASISGRSNGERVYVRLGNGSRIAVPIGMSTTVGQTMEEALRRARRLGLSYGDSALLQTISNDPLTLFEEDMIADALEDTEGQTFTLVLQSPNITPTVSPVQHLPSVPSTTTASNMATGSSFSSIGQSFGLGKGSKVYIRWVTPKASIRSSRLCDIMPSESYLRSTVRLADLTRIALDHLFPPSIAQHEELKQGLQVELFLSSCHIKLNLSDHRTIGDLGVESSRKLPMDIFVCPIGPSTLLTSPNELRGVQSSWAFDCTERSIATFTTSLKIFLAEVGKPNFPIDLFLQVLWEVTHFPPALIAFRKIHESGMDRPDNIAFGVFAYCFRELARAIVPPWISDSPKTVLEASRQIFSWLHSLRPTIDGTSEEQYVRVPEIELQEISRHEDQVLVGRLAQSGYIDLTIHISESETSNKRIFLSTDNREHITARTVAVALYGNFSSPWDHCFYFPSVNGKLIDHRRTALLHPADFDNLLETTNHVDAFKMVGPLQLASCASVDLPVITLDADGFVSIFDQEDIECGEKSFFTSNTVKGKSTMPDTNPGQFLLQKLEPVIVERKKEGSWEVDAWGEDLVHGPQNPDECIVICVDTSSSMSMSMGSGWLLASQPDAVDPSRLDVVKDVFTNLVTRISAHKLNTRLGLVTFSSQSNVRTNQALTGVLLNFQNKLDGITAWGNTAIWDALQKGKDMLMAEKGDNKDMKCRIILLTDGQNNNSRHTASNVAAELHSSDIVLDAIVIGTNSTNDLFKMARITGGYAFAPQSRSLLYQIPMLETVIDIRMRPDIVKTPSPYSYESVIAKQPDMPTLFDFPRCRPHANESDDFIALRDADRYLRNSSRSTNKTSSSSSSSSRPSSISSWSHVSSASSDTYSVRSIMSGTTIGASGITRLIHSEVKAMIENQHPSMDVYVSESNMGYWKVAMQGPPDSPYENGTFLLSIDLGDQFPRRAPNVRFITPVLHPNITKHGKICHPIFDREWNASLRVYEILQHLWSMFTSFEIRDAVDPLFTVQRWTDPVAARTEVEQYVERFATRPRPMLRSDIVGSTTSSLASNSPPASISSTSSPSRLANTSAFASMGATRPITTRTVPSSNSPSSDGSAVPRPSPLASYLRNNRAPSASNSSGASSRRRTFFSRILDESSSRKSSGWRPPQP